LKNAKNRLLARAARNRRFVFVITYRGATAREHWFSILFQKAHTIVRGIYSPTTRILNVSGTIAGRGLGVAAVGWGAVPR
jgi:hypothetical protein